MSFKRSKKRKIQKKVSKTVETQMKIYTDNVKQESVKKAVDAFAIASFMVLHDKFGFGEMRLKKFNSEISNLFECILEDYVTLEDMRTEIKESFNISI